MSRPDPLGQMGIAVRATDRDPERFAAYAALAIHHSIGLSTDEQVDWLRQAADSLNELAGALAAFAIPVNSGPIGPLPEGAEGVKSGPKGG